ncbi:MAG: glycoside hydrolase family 32 protein [Spirochaetales bacterium]|nr:glycoside hydrolase family 32 protein [Spirochaetales bacterium]
MKVFDESARPTVHFTPRRGWMNDPNGCVLHNGVYHLYFQFRIGDVTRPPTHWGHATSDDLIHWKEHPVAIYPDARLGEAFSGSVVIDPANRDRLLAFFTSHREIADGRAASEHQSLAVSIDGGETWRYRDQNPVVSNPGYPDFRDPKVLYHAESEAWVMVLTSGASILFYRSEDLTEWNLTGEFEWPALSKGCVWECPDLIPFDVEHGGTVWVLVVSRLERTNAGFSTVWYFTGSFDGRSFNATGAPRLVDHGGDFYATHRWHGMESARRGHVWTAWANNWAYAHAVPTRPWMGVLVVPRSLSIVRRDAGFVLRQYPVVQLRKLVNRSDHITPRPDDVTVVNLNGSPAHAMRTVVADADRGHASITVRYTGGETWTLRWTGSRRELLLDTGGLTGSAFSPHYRTCHGVSVPESNDLEVSVLLDSLVVEVFINRGEIVFTNQIFPHSALERAEFTSGDGTFFQGVVHETLKSMRCP